MVWYFSNSDCQALSLKGGTVPVSGFHSTIESPDSVSLVAPPTRTIAKISPATASSRADLRDGPGRWRNQADGVRALDRRMEATDRYGSALERERLAVRVREVPDHPAVSAGEPRDDAR